MEIIFPIILIGAIPLPTQLSLLFRKGLSLIYILRRPHFGDWDDYNPSR
jgi:hypothetical protein